MTDIKQRLLEASVISSWRNICTAAHDHIAAQEKRIAELEAKIAADAIDANRLAMWLSSSLGIHDKCDEIRSHIKSWIDHNNAAMKAAK